MQEVKILLLVYDVSNRESFENITEWYKKVEAVNPGQTIYGKLKIIYENIKLK
jgi:Ras family.